MIKLPGIELILRDLILTSMPKEFERIRGPIFRAKSGANYHANIG